MSNRPFYRALGIKKGDPLSLMQIIRIAQMRSEQDAARQQDHALCGKALQPGEQVIVRAVQALDPATDAHWTAAGKPALRAVRIGAGSQAVRRADIDRLAPHVSRSSAKEQP